MLQNTAARRNTHLASDRQLPATRIRQAVGSIVLLLLSFSGSGAFAESISDLLIALESDGRSHTVQHTLATEDELLIVDLPGSVIPQVVRFMGPDRDTFIYAHTKRPERIALWSGSSFARYHHQYGAAVEQTTPGTFLLNTNSPPVQLTVRDDSQFSSSITWVFPSEFEVLQYSSKNTSLGEWIEENNTLTFRQSGSEPAELLIEYRYREPVEVAEEIDPCDTASSANDACSPDDDEDGVPDYRDICLSLPTDEQDENTENSEKNISELGCAVSDTLVLEGISFATGRSYIDVNARRLLDRVANAMQHFPAKVFEIGAHTDNQGTESNNQRLSGKRADAVRHYLMLRGVGPNQVQAKGYGESTPLGDNETLEGRRINRRVELTGLQ